MVTRQSRGGAAFGVADGFPEREPRAASTNPASAGYSASA
jgi:hypothetical protein